ncbi:hypothetical protein B0T18DRAFT_419912 [Schizothecium vesticola]|uniref:Uncharacterized protein n=1 Tax=Schizothecium vesticola TaxID=314040 RepID=A0AA40EL26_9PEZI|nr:hypothetical protein B0T18DRAFT_419912 [Schizothecium vesticola]
MPGMSAPSLEDHAALGLSGEEQVSSPNPATSKADYTQGFGSFWFHRQDPEPIHKSHKKRIKFPFLRLPLEIRRMIYRCLVDGLAIAGPDITIEAPRPDAGLRFRVKEDEDPSDSYDPAHRHERPIPPLYVQEAPDQRTRQLSINNGVDTEILDVLGVYRSIADPSYPQAAGTPTAAQQPQLYFEIRSMDADAESDEAEFSDAEDSDASSWCSDEAEVVSHQRWRHNAQTNSSGPFISDSDMDMDGEYDTGPSQANTGCSRVLTTLRVTTAIDASPESASFYKSKEGKVRAAVRNLSLTSTEIARELGEVLWAKATVRFESPSCFLAFARDRPAALPFIHGIVVELDVDDGDWLPDGATHAMVAMARIVSENCRLRFWSTLFQTSSYHLGPYHTRGSDEKELQSRAVIKGIARWTILLDQLGVDSIAETQLSQPYARCENYILE